MMLQVQEIDTFYGLVHMLRGISLEVAAGEVVALLGRNGAGKTTVIKSIMGLAPPRAGRIVFKGEDITGLPPHAIARRGVSYVPASRGIFSALTLRENLEIVRTKGSRWNPEGIFRLFPRLESIRDRRGRSLSGGEQQMLAIGRALLTDPSLILLDEPSQGLAPLVVEAVLEILRRLKAEGMSMILVEQNVAASLKLAAQAYVLENGRIVLSGRGEELLHNDRVRQAYLGL